MASTHALTMSEMVEVAEAVNDAYEFVMGNTYGESKLRVIKFVADLVLRQKPYMVVSREGFLALSGDVFSVEDHRDFLFTLYYAFASRWGMSAQRYSMLAANLAHSTMPVIGVADVSGAPTAIAQRLASATETQALIEANPWLAVVLLLQTFIRVSPPKSH